MKLLILAIRDSGKRSLLAKSRYGHVSKRAGCDSTEGNSEEFDRQLENTFDR